MDQGIQKKKEDIELKKKGMIANDVFRFKGNTNIDVEDSRIKLNLLNEL